MNTVKRRIRIKITANRIKTVVRGVCELVIFACVFLLLGAVGMIERGAVPSEIMPYILTVLCVLIVAFGIWMLMGGADE